jgi:hypothetical protein
VLKKDEETCGCFNEDKMKAKSRSEERELSCVKRLDYFYESV